MAEWFRKAARITSTACGTWQAFTINTAAVLIWLALGPVLAWSDGWQLIANTATTVITYLLLFLVMNTQGRDTTQIILKLNAIIAAQPKVSNRMITLEDLSEEDISRLRKQLDKIANTASEAKE